MRRRRWLFVALVVVVLVLGTAAALARRSYAEPMPDLSAARELGRRPVFCPSGIALAVSYDRPGTLPDDPDYWALYATLADLRAGRPLVVFVYREGPEYVEPVAILVDLDRDGRVDRRFATARELMAVYPHPCDLLDDVQSSRAR